MPTNPVAQRWERLPGVAAKPQKRAQLHRLRIEFDPDNASTWPTHQTDIDADLCCPCLTMAGLKLDVPHDAVPFENYVVTPVVYFGSQNLNISGATAPQTTKQFTYEEVLEHLLASARLI